MQTQITPAGIDIVISGKTASIGYMAAGSTRSQSDMQRWLSGQSHTGKYILYPIDSRNTYLRGDTYTRPDGTSYTVEDSFQEFVGSFRTSEAEESFSMRSIAVIADLLSGRIVYAYGTVQSGETAYPVNTSDVIMYTTPVRVVFSADEPAEPEGMGVPWRDFIGHADTSVGTGTAHGLHIDIPNKILYVDGQAVPLPEADLGNIERRLEALENRMDHALYFRQSDTRIYNSEWEDRMEGSGTASDPYRIYTPKDFYNIRDNPGAWYVMENSLDFLPALGKYVTVTETSAEGTVLDESAPLYNEGMGWDNFAFTGYLDGNGCAIRNLYTDYPEGNPYGAYHRKGSLFSVLEGTVRNLEITDSVFMAGRASSDGSTSTEIYMGTFASSLSREGGGSALIENCISKACLVETSNRRSRIGGIAGIYGTTNADSVIRFCAGHARFYNFIDSNIGSIGGIIGMATKSMGTFEGNYSDSDISVGEYRGGICGRQERTGGLGINLFWGNAVGSRSYSIASTSTAETYASCYSLIGSASHMQGAQESADTLRDPLFVSQLNLLLGSPAFVSQDGQFPKFVWESSGIPLSSQLAVVDPSDQGCYYSGYTLKDMNSLATFSDMVNLKGYIASASEEKSKATAIPVTIQPSEWSASGKYTFPGQVITRSGIPVILIADSSEFFDSGVYLESQSYSSSGGSVTVKYGTAPQSAVSFTALIIT